MTLSEISIRRPVFAWMLMFALIVFGAISFQRMGISQMPDVNFPVVNIALRLDNAAPEVMERNVVDIVEDAVMGIEGLKSVSSSVSQGTANITCEFHLNRDIDIALQVVQSRIAQAQNRLPTLLYPPVVTKTNPEDQALLWVMLSAEERIPLHEQMMYARNTLRDQFSTITGVGNVQLAGFVEPNLRVWMDRKRMYAYSLTSADISSAIQAEQIEQPAGRIEAPEKEMNIRVLGEANSPEAFRNILINQRGGAANFNPITLSTVAGVEEGLSDIRAISRFNQKTVVGLGIVKQHGANAVEVGNLIHKKVAQILPALKSGYKLEVKLDSTKYIKDSVQELNFTLLVSAILTSIICYLFLGSWSSTFNVLLAIPTSIVGAFSALYFFGFTLNTFTLLGLSLAIGIVVDDAIMMLENIVRHHEMGKNRRQAALEGSREITFAAIATTLAIAAIFVPVVFMQGVVGKFFYQYGITVTVAVFLSLLEALTLTPMRCARFLQTAKASPSKLLSLMDSWMGRLASAYERSLRFAIAHEWKVLLLSLGLFAGSLFFVSTLRKELIPEQDQSLFLLTIKTPVGSSIQKTDAVFREAEAYLAKRADVADIYSTIGNHENNNVVNVGTIYVILRDPKLRKLSQREIMEEVRTELKAKIGGVEIFGQDLSLSGFSATRGFPVEFTIEGPDWAALQGHSKKLLDRLAASRLVVDINTDYQDGMPEVHVIPDRKKSAAKGISVSTIAQEVQNMIGGQILNANTQYPKEGHRYDIRLRTEADQHADPKDVEELLLRNNRGTSGELVKLADAADVKVEPAPQLISRYNRSRAVPVFANIAPGESQDAALREVERLGKEILPAGYYVRILGSGEAFREAFNGLLFALVLGIAVAYMILASQFNSFIHPITILMALPFSLTGALLALAVTHQSISMFSMIGLILLMGIVKKNSILLVDFTNQRRGAGRSVTQALLEACPVRLRPILMTSAATVVGAIPGAINFGPGAETRIPMAISIIGGVSISTLLTLYVVPCVYSILSRWESAESLESAENGARA